MGKTITTAGVDTTEGVVVTMTTTIGGGDEKGAVLACLPDKHSFALDNSS